MATRHCLLLTGGAGFVGRRLAPRLAAAFPAMRCVSVARTDSDFLPGWESVSLDLADEGAVAALVAELRPKLIVHLAAQSSVGQLSQAAEATWRSNFGGSFSLARAVARNNLETTVLFTSTGEVYGSSFRDGPASESTPAAPTNSYAISKLAAEQVFKDILPECSQLIIARAFNHSGPGQDERFVLPSFAAQIARAEVGLAPANIFVGNLAAERDFLHVDDVIEAYIALLDRRDFIQKRVVVNISSGMARSLSAMLEDMLKRARVPIEVTTDQKRMRPSDIPIIVGNSGLLRSLTGWSVRITTGHMIDSILDYQRRRQGSDQSDPLKLDRLD